MVTLARVTPVTEDGERAFEDMVAPLLGRVLRPPARRRHVGHRRRRPGGRCRPTTASSAARASRTSRTPSPWPPSWPSSASTRRPWPAALLHDAVEDTGLTLESIEEMFGPGVAKVVDGVTKLDRLQFDSKEAQQAATIRKMLVAMADDWRVLLIKLADRLHNMRTLAVMPEWKQRRTAQETFDVYAPLGPPPGRAAGALAARGPGLRHACTPSATPRSSRWWPPGPPSARSTSPGCWSTCASGSRPWASRPT